MSATMLQDLTLAMAVDWRNPTPGLVHHWDRGSRYAAGDYRQVLQARGITVSMTREGDCWDNAPMVIGQWHGQGRVRAKGTFPHARRGPAGAGRIFRLLQYRTSPLVLAQPVPGGIRAALAWRRVADQRRWITRLASWRSTERVPVQGGLRQPQCTGRPCCHRRPSRFRFVVQDQPHVGNRQDRATDWPLAPGCNHHHSPPNADPRGNRVEPPEVRPQSLPTSKAAAQTAALPCLLETMTIG